MPTTGDNESTSASAVPYLNDDGCLDFEKIAKVQAQVLDALKKDTAEGKKEGLTYKPSAFYVIGVKAKPIKFSASMDKKADVSYLKKRITKIVSRKTLKPEAFARVKIALTVVDCPSLTKAVRAQVALIEKAVVKHMAKIEKVKAVIDKTREKSQKVKGAAFNTALVAARKVLLSAGIKEEDIVEAAGFMGAKTVLVKLSKDVVVSLGVSDMDKFKDAKKRLSESTSGRDSTSGIMDAKGVLMKWKNGMYLEESVENNPLHDRMSRSLALHRNTGETICGWVNVQGDQFSSSPRFAQVAERFGSYLKTYLDTIGRPLLPSVDCPIIYGMQEVSVSSEESTSDSLLGPNDKVVMRWENGMLLICKRLQSTGDHFKHEYVLMDSNGEVTSWDVAGNPTSNSASARKFMPFFQVYAALIKTSGKKDPVESKKLPTPSGF